MCEVATVGCIFFNPDAEVGIIKGLELVKLWIKN